jgi:hypothetical protein
MFFKAAPDLLVEQVDATIFFSNFKGNTFFGDTKVNKLCAFNSICTKNYKKVEIFNLV